MNTRMKRDRLNIGTYYLRPYACSERHVRELSECGIDFVLNMQDDRPTLDLFAKYGIGAVLTGIVPGWWGSDGGNAGTMLTVNTPDLYEKAAAAFADHPAVWGIDIGDEPSALDFPYYGTVYDRVSKLFPMQFPYINLYPNYASVAKNKDAEVFSQLGTATYAEHIDAYCQNLPADYLCFDFYVYSANVQKFYENLRITSDACLRTGRQPWIVLQVNSHKPEKWITRGQLRYQAFTSMAFGAENIIWACYTAGWWSNQVLDKEGNKTEQYDKLKTVNAEIRALSETYMRYRRTATRAVGFEGTEWLSGTGLSSVKALNTGVVMDLCAEGCPLLVGEMTSRTGDGSHALMICAADDPYDEKPSEYEITFRVTGENHEVKAEDGHGKLPVARREDGTYAVKIASSAGVLITVK